MWTKSTSRNWAIVFIFMLSLLIVLAGCGGGGAGATGGGSSGSGGGSGGGTGGSGGGGGGGGGTTPPATTVTISPVTAQVRIGATSKFTATVTNNTNMAVAWAVNSVAGGNATVGRIASDGTYTAPASMPSMTSVIITAASIVDPAAANATVTFLNPMPVITVVSPAFIPTGAFTLTVNGSNFLTGAQVTFAGQALPTTFVSANQLTATGIATAAQAGSVAVAVVNPNPGTITSANYSVTVSNSAPAVSANAAARFLEQTTFGPTPQSIAHVQQVGFDAFLAEQFALPASTLPFDINTAADVAVQNQFFVNAVSGQNQLRQRMAFALQQTMVISGVKIAQSDPASVNGIATWQQMMENDAFGNYATLLKDVTLSPVMGNYLDMVNNDKPGAGKNPNENYAREVLQLFSIGLYELNPDGSQKLDGSGNPINTYDQDVVEGYAHLFTGWTYPLKPGATAAKHNPQYYGGGPMVIFESNHDTSAKEILDGVTLPAGQTSTQDLNAGLAAIANHPNVGPFICTQLIRHLVKSNPSPAYIQRVTTVFADNGQGVRGDLKAVARAIFFDPEARADDAATQSAGDSGHLREPALYMAGILRAMSATTDGTKLVGYGANMGQNILYPGSVFNYFHPDYEVPDTNSFGPEFEILGPATAIARSNFVADLVLSTVSGTPVDFSSWTSLAADPNQMLNAMNSQFLHGQMSAPMHDAILTAVNAVPANQPTTRAKQALYLVLTSPQYQVAH